MSLFSAKIGHNIGQISVKLDFKCLYMDAVLKENYGITFKNEETLYYNAVKYKKHNNKLLENKSFSLPEVLEL